MKLTRKLLLVLVTVLNGVGGLAQNLSNKGKEFWVGYGHHQFMEWSITNPTSAQANSQEMVLYLSAEQPANVTVSVYGTTWVKNYSVPAGTVISTDFIPKTAPVDARFFTVPPSFGGTGGEGVFSNKALHIVSDVPIVAYAHIYGSASSGATMLMPVETWGYAYTSVNSKQQYAADCYSWMYVIAQEDNTVVEIIPSVPTRMGRTAGVPFTATLMKGEAYQIIGANKSGTTTEELTGTRVKSIANASGKCYPVAVFSGSSRTSNPASCGSGGGDNDNQQLFPTQAWGRRYLTAPTSSSNAPTTYMRNTFKVVAKDPNTVVKLNGSTVATLNPGQYHTFESNQPNYIESDKPIMVGQFMTGGACLSGGWGDPEMFFISPLEQGIKRIGFYRNNMEAIQVNYLTLIIPDNGVNSLKIDGVLNNYNAVIPHPRLAGYSIVVKKWNAAKAQAWAESDSAFTAVTYGLGNVESYAYNAGTMINNLNILGSIHNELDSTTLEHAYTCTNTPVQLGVRVAYQPTKMEWQLSKLGSVISPNADVTVNNPVAVDTVQVKGISYYRYQLPQSYTFSDSGDYEVTIISTNPNLEKCDKTEEVKFTIKVRNKPKAAFTFSHTGCVTDTLYLQGPAGTANGYGISRWNWTFPDGTTSNIQNPKTVLPATGVNDIKLRVISTEGCVADTVQPVTATPRPTAGFTFAPSSICEGGSISFSDNSVPGGTAPLNAWVWDFGNGTTLNATNAGAQTATYPAYGTDTVKLVVKTSPTCVSDTASKIVNVYARPITSFSFPSGCLPADGLVQFKSTTTIPDGQAISSYAWNFGDANATGANPNTSTLQDPAHYYSSFGNYTIKHTATTVNGCTKDTVVTVTFNLSPVLSYPSLSPLCENATPVSVASASVTNGVVGTGVYRGPATTAAGQFSPSTAGAGTHTLWYVFTTTGGCRDSISQTIVVYPKPTALFSVNADICLDKTATLTDRSTVASGSIASWTWSFGDGTAPVTYNNGASFTRSFAAQGSYVVRLVTTSDQGCISDTARQTIAVHPLPVASFELPQAVCLPGGPAQFTNRSTVGENAALSYQWSFGDGGTATTPSPSHVYAAAGSYAVKLTATSSFGCVSDTTKVFSAFFDKPIALFSVNSDTLCQGQDTRFTDGSSAPNSTVQSWRWSFGDGGRPSSQPSPLKRYQAPGEYTVELVVTNAVGCSSDPYTHTVKVYLQPVVDAGPSFVVPQGTTIKFNPTVNDSTSVSFAWGPSAGLSDGTALRPTMVAQGDGTYTLSATGEWGCTARDFLTVKILRPVVVPNAFSPNGDGVNDRWEIENLADYPGATVEVFNRYGQPVFYSPGYNTPWDGTQKGNALPVATYYYVITLKNGFQPITGAITIVR